MLPKACGCITFLARPGYLGVMTPRWTSRCMACAAWHERFVHTLRAARIPS
jgi:hypothetical protein